MWCPHVETVVIRMLLNIALPYMVNLQTVEELTTSVAHPEAEEKIFISCIPPGK